MTWHPFRTILAAVLVPLVFGGVSACSDLSGLAGNQPLPAGIPGPNSLDTRDGALVMYQNALTQFRAGTRNGVSGSGTFVDFVFTAGLLTDELGSGNLGGAPADYTSTLINNQIDTRQLPEGIVTSGLDQVYSNLQGVRNSAHVASSALAAYDTVDSPALRGQMYALEGYSIVLMAELYCSGVPLSTLDFHGDFTYRAGSSTTQLFQAAVAKFDTALTLSSDSARILNLARVGKGRAYLALAQYDSAAAAVASVPNDYRYQFQVEWGGGNFGLRSGGLFSAGSSNGLSPFSGGFTEVDSQGTNGLPYLSSGDPRTAGDTAWRNINGQLEYVPNKYGGLASDTVVSVILPITVADGIEARLIQAEAEYHGVATGMGNWLGELNALRQTAISPALPTVNDPGTDAGRVALLFQERAYWLYLTGHRQGDMRRLIRNYNLLADAVYPVGDYPLFNQFQTFGIDVNVPIPTTEHNNPSFTGCLSRGA